MADKNTPTSNDCQANIKKLLSECNQSKDENNLENVVLIKNSVFDSLPVSITVTNNVSDQVVVITLIDFKECANGSFGTVYEGYLQDNIHIAVKKVLQDKKYKNRELEVMRSLDHNNITTLLYFFYTTDNNINGIFLNLVMDFVPQTISRILKFYFKNKSFMPMKYIRIYSYQVLRGINYMHQKGICHRDIKPQNLLVNPSLSLLRICDFGSAKCLITTENNISYICSRYYRAPELIFGASRYSVKIDIWSIGCVIAEILLNKPFFPGDTSLDQLVEIIKIIGTPSKEEICDMNEHYKSYNLPIVKPVPLIECFSNPEISEDITNFLLLMLNYSPTKRISAIKALTHPFFNELRDPEFQINGGHYPPLFDFSLTV